MFFHQLSQVPFKIVSFTLSRENAPLLLQLLPCFLKRLEMASLALDSMAPVLAISLSSSVTWLVIPSRLQGMCLKVNLNSRVKTELFSHSLNDLESALTSLGF